MADNWLEYRMESYESSTSKKEALKKKALGDKMKAYGEKLKAKKEAANLENSSK